jgi:phosphoglycerol transferase MdoB-like AlkP superfamily enzyme
MTVLRSLAVPARVLLLLVLLLTASRAVLITWYWGRVAPTQGVEFILLQGFRFDLVLMGMLLGPAFLFAAWFSGHRRGGFLLRCYLVFVTMFVCWLELGTIPYSDQYDTRPNFVYVEYLAYPREVFSMLFASYGMLMVAMVGLTLAAGFAVWRMSRAAMHEPVRNRVAGALLLTPLILLISSAMIRSTLDHRPVNPSTVAFTSDTLVNQLALNSPYTLIYAIYEQNRDARDGTADYGKMERDEVLRIVLDDAGLADEVDLQSATPTMHWQTATRRLDKPMNLVIILEESLGAEFVGSLGGKNLTPNLDALADDGIWFEQLYATGIRSVRGVEAIVSGFPPTSKRSVVKLAETQRDFFTIAGLLENQNYQTSFIYGGSAHFDNMGRFFLHNGFQTVIDQKHFDDPDFVATWGVSDGDLFRKAHEYLDEMDEQPFFSLIFSSSNHKPFEIPPGKVTTRTGMDGPRETAISYADYALGEYLRVARSSDYYDNTVFLVISDHNSRVKGARLIPVERFHIPGVIFGGGIEPRRISGISSQVDLLPTLLSLIGIDGRHPAVGYDLTLPEYAGGAGRAQMQFHDTHGWLVPGQLVVMQPDLPMQVFDYQPGGELVPARKWDSALLDQALAHALFPSLMIKERGYRPPAVD